VKKSPISRFFLLLDFFVENLTGVSHCVVGAARGALGAEDVERSDAFALTVVAVDVDARFPVLLGHDHGVELPVVVGFENPGLNERLAAHRTVDGSFDVAVQTVLVYVVLAFEEDDALSTAIQVLKAD